MRSYFSKLPAGMVVLWCYLIWYLGVVYLFFDPTPSIWLNAIGISGIIGVALILSVTATGGTRLGNWQRFRLFLMPFCVSSFSALIKGRGFFLILPPKPSHLALLILACALFLIFVRWTKRN